MNKPIAAGLAKARVGRILVASVVSVLAGYVFNASAQTETNLYSFSGGGNNNSHGGLVQGSDGNFYGTTAFGGVNESGTVFRISPSGSFTNLYSFGNSPADGSGPFGGVIEGSDGNFYGTTSGGGVSNAGTVFRISPDGNLTNLHSFSHVGASGASPNGRLVQGNDGNYYGTTLSGGPLLGGTVFRITPSGSLTNLWAFNLPCLPSGGLVQGSDSNFYGTTEIGGANQDGTVFRISPNGTFTNLYTFSGNDGAGPQDSLVQGNDGNFYGTTLQGGTSSNGTLFRISPNGNFTNLYSFAGYPNDGQNPSGELVLGSDGNFYGATVSGGTNGNGIVFRISPGGSLTNLYTFAGYPNDGQNPSGGLVQGSDGNFYGVTEGGGSYSNGTIFRISVPLSPPANQISAVQVAGNDVAIGIPSVAYETYQLQFSSSMNPTNWVNVPGVSVTNSIGALLTLTNFGGAVGPQGFYRFAITP